LILAIPRSDPMDTIGNLLPPQGALQARNSPVTRAKGSQNCIPYQFGLE
jgi:hypothetical protein